MGAKVKSKVIPTSFLKIVEMEPFVKEEESRESGSVRRIRKSTSKVEEGKIGRSKREIRK